MIQSTLLSTHPKFLFIVSIASCNGGDRNFLNILNFSFLLRLLPPHFQVLRAFHSDLSSSLATRLVIRSINQLRQILRLNFVSHPFHLNDLNISRWAYSFPTTGLGIWHCHPEFVSSGISLCMDEKRLRRV